MRQRAAESDVVIVNHHLLCADASIRQSAYGEVIPSCPTLVVDEAHQLEDVATQFFGVASSNFRIDDLVRDGERLPGREGLDAALSRVVDVARRFFSGLAMAPRREDRARYSAESIADHVEEGMALGAALQALEETVVRIFQLKPEPKGKNNE